MLGWDAAGIVEAVGAECVLFQVDDEVYYAGDITRPGSDSEFHVVDERIVGHKPKRLDYAEAAAALPLTTITACEGLFERLGVSQQPAENQGRVSSSSARRAARAPSRRKSRTGRVYRSSVPPRAQKRSSGSRSTAQTPPSTTISLSRPNSRNWGTRPSTTSSVSTIPNNTGKTWSPLFTPRAKSA